MERAITELQLMQSLKRPLYFLMLGASTLMMTGCYTQLATD